MTTLAYVALMCSLPKRILARFTWYSTHGFDYGSLSPGAMDLARSMLADYRGRISEARLYRAFLHSIIRPLDPHAPWTVSGAAIAAWLAIMEAEDCAGGS